MIPSLQNLSSKRKSKSISSFINKTYNLLNDIENSKIVRWSDNGIGFVILNQEQFAKLLLPKYFKHSNYSSFVRQLNMYNFHKIRQQNGQSYFHHNHFDRQNEISLTLIKRKPQNKKKKNLQESDPISQSFHSFILNQPPAKKNLIEHLQTPVSFSKDISLKKIQENDQKVQVKSKDIQQNERLMTTRQLFSSQFTIKFQNLGFQSLSSKRINQQFFQEDQDDKDQRISINNQIEERIIMVAIPTKELMYPSKKNIFPIGNLKDAQSYEIFF